MKKYFFVEHSKGEFTSEKDGKDVIYDNVILSDGIRAMKLKNNGRIEKFDFSEGEQVIPTFEIHGGKNDSVVVSLIDLKLAK